MNKLVMQCYFQSDPSKRNYRKRMHVIWNEIGGFELTEQKLVGQARAIRTNKWLSDLELEQLQRKIRSEERKQHQQTCINDDRPEATVNKDRKKDIGEQRHETLIERKAEVNEEENQIMEKLVEELSKESIEQPPNLRGIDRKRLKGASEEADRVPQHVTLRMETLKQLNNILKAVGNVVAGLVGGKKKRADKKRKPCWKRRIQGKVKELRKDLSRLVTMKEMRLGNPQLLKTLREKCKVREKGYNVVIEELRQRITANNIKIKSYNDRCDHFRQNRLFISNQQRLLQELEGNKNEPPVVPDAESSKGFWNSIWSESKVYNGQADWLNDIEENLGTIRKQETLTVTEAMVEEQIKKILSWKAPGPDGVHGYWFKCIKAVRPVLAALLNEAFQSGNVPEWLTRGKTVLIVKDKDKANEVTNFRPNTCLPIM